MGFLRDDYVAPSVAVIALDAALPLMNSGGPESSPTIGDYFDPEDAVDQFSSNKSWNDSWNNE